MKASQALRKAAARVATRSYNTKEWMCGCQALMDITDGEPLGDYEAAMRYFTLTRPQNADTFWFGPVDKWRPGSRSAKAHRIIALCLAADVAEAEGQ